jgi:cytoskeletal protein CcmA (bactofilin family)
MAVENAPARIGKTIVICGEVKGSEDLIVDGRVEGTVNLSESRLTIGPTAIVAANLSAKDILIMGQVQGNLVASGRVELRAGCQVEGDIRALRLAVEDNAVFRGKVDLTQAVSKGSQWRKRAAGRRLLLTTSCAPVRARLIGSTARGFEGA